jgi:methyl-accepting chemotaxis protein
MGFAVVADEVRSLAQRSARAARETTEKIEGAISDTSHGVEISIKVAAALHDIVLKVREVDTLATEVAVASQEQSQGIAQINIAIGQVDQVTQATAAHAEESAGAATQLQTQANTLKQAMDELMVLVEGGNSAHTVTPQTVEYLDEAPVVRVRPANNGVKRSTRPNMSVSA